VSFTLAICTYNRAGLLRQALASIAECANPRSAWELIVVDNNSKDDTAAVVQGFEGRLPIRRCFESEQGLSAARNRAIAECRSDVLLFTDDDLRFDRDWLRCYEAAFATQHAAAWFGGRVRPLWEAKRPAWLVDEHLPLISGLLVHYDLGAHDRSYASNDPSPFGASFALRRSVFEHHGKFRLDLGVKGNVPGRGEEAEYFDRLRTAGEGGWYVGASSAWHWQDPKRFTLRHLYRYGVEKGRAEVRLNRAQVRLAATYVAELGYVARALGQIAKGRGDRARQCVINVGIQRGLRTTPRG
jgi:glycosyltransferase involved in cell wall biosynthesis